MLFLIAGASASAGAVSSDYMDAVSDTVGSGALSYPDTALVNDMEEAVVIVDRGEKEVVPTQRLAGERLKMLNTLSVADAIRYFSGVQIKDYGGVGGLKTVNVRSLGSQHVGIFYDGVEVGNAQNGVVDLGRFSLDNMEAVTLYNGQRSAVLQPAKDYASSNAVYMTTRTPVFSGEKSYNFRFGLRGGSFGTINPSVLYEQRLSPTVSLSTSAEFLYTTGRYRFRYAKEGGYDTTALRQNGDVRMTRAEAALFGTIDDGYWKAKVYFYDSERGYPGAVVRETPGKFTHEDRQWDDNLFIQGSFKKRFSQSYVLLLSGKYSYDYLHYLSDPRQDVTTMYVENRYHQQEAYLSAAHLYTPFKWWNISISTDFQWNKLNADLIDFAYPQRYSLYAALASSWEVGGFDISASLLYLYLNDHTRVEGAGTKSRNQFSPSVVASYRPIKSVDLTFRAFYKNVFRMPTFNDLYYTFIGNKYLEPETTDQYNVGVTYRYELPASMFKGFGITADCYFNRIKNKIIAMPTSNQFRWTMMNLGSVRVVGADLLYDMGFDFSGVEVTARLAYTYQKASDVTDPSSPWFGGQVPYIPEHSGSAILQGTYMGWSLNYSFIYTGERYEAVANIPENYVNPWYTHDISLSKAFLLEKGMELRATVEVNNLLNQQYEVVQCYPMPGTNFMIKLHLTL